LDAKYNEISSCHLDGIEDDDTKERLKKKLMESNEARRDLLDVIDVPDLTEDERRARMKPARKPRKDKGTDTEMRGKEEIDVLAMKLDLNIMVGGTVPVIILSHYEHSMNTL